MSQRRVVITGIGIWSCIGTDVDTVKESLYNGRCGIGLQPERVEYGYRSALTGIVPAPVIIIRKVKNFNILFWPCIFPLIMGTLFYFAFGNMSEADFETVQAAYVEEKGDPVFSRFLEIGRAHV